MEEDVLGTRAEAVGKRYVTCTACGRVWDRRATTLEERDLPEETLSEQAELCPACRRERAGADEAQSA